MYQNNNADIDLISLVLQTVDIQILKIRSSHNCYVSFHPQFTMIKQMQSIELHAS